jgi:hypothetical protein
MKEAFQCVPTGYRDEKKPLEAGLEAGNYILKTHPRNIAMLF